MANHTPILPLAKYAGIEEAIAAEASINRTLAHIVHVQALQAGPRLSFPEFIAFHDKYRGYRIDGNRGQFYSFTRGMQGPGNLTITQWYDALAAWIERQDPHDLRDTEECAADVAVQ